MKRWEKIDSKTIQKTRVFDLQVHRMRHPESNYEDDFYSLQVGDWANIIAITEAREVVLVEQYRFGIHDFSLEIPGGFVDKAEDPLDSALRELTEETGYVADGATALGFAYPNPALQNNKIHYYFAQGVRHERPQNLEPAENIRVHLVPLDGIAEAIRNRKIGHSLTITAFMMLSLRFGVPLRGLDFNSAHL